ncbi:hypothetical protein BJ944DRAFT_237876 [Cunninghamella echinulata]|nr:hypothetical protein BJ944DRAFT_237876 [Cunninghamella echinulata]
MSDTGEDQKGFDSSVPTFISALWFNAALAVGFFVAFLILKNKRPQTYAPRTYAIPLEKRPPTLSKGPILWIVELLKIPDDQLIKSMGLDRFMMLKFLRMGIVVFVSFSIIAIPILFPLNIIGQKDSPGLNLLTMGNVDDARRLWAHLVLSIVLTAGLIYYTFRETRHYLVLKRNYLLSDEYRESVMARSLFVPSIPEGINNVEALKRIFGRFPGGVRFVWLNRDLKDLPDQVNERQKNVCNLESTITKVILASYKHNAKNTNKDLENGTIENGIIPEKLRPTHRVKPSFLPFGLPGIGRKVDSIQYYNEEITRLNQEIEAKQRDIKSYTQRNSAFIEFNQQAAAQMAAQTLIHHEELKMAPRYIQIAPNDIIWENMNIKSSERLIRRFISISVTSVIIIFWAIPITFVQAISNLDKLSNILPFLKFIQLLGPTIVGIFQGIIPPVFLAILISLVPIVFSMLSKLEGIPQRSFVTLSLLHKYFSFQYVDVVLVSTIAGGVINTISQLGENPLGIINVLAENLPKASTFFITFVMLQAINGAGSAILQLVPFIMSFIKPFLSTTPRDIYMQKRTLAGVNIGTLIPSHTVIFILGILYSTIAPLILPFTCLFFCLHYFVYLYQFLYVYELEYETAGRGFTRAIRHIYVGILTWQLTMVGLFAVRGNEAIGQLVVMIILVFVTIFSLAVYDKSFKPLIRYIPIESFDDVSTTTKSSTLNGKSKTMEVLDNKGLSNNVHVKHIEEDKRGLTSAESLSSQSSISHSQNQSHIANGETTATETSSSSQELRQRKAQQQHNHLEHDDEDDALFQDANTDAEEYYFDMKAKLEKEVSKSNTDDDVRNPAVSTSVKQLYASQAYMHPAAFSTQSPVWIPEDELGITKKELEELKSKGVYAVSQYATCYRNNKQKGKVEIDEETLIVQQKGIPGALPAPGRYLCYVQDYIRTFVDNFNYFASASVGGNIFGAITGQF